MRVTVLGAVGAHHNGAAVPLAGRRQRALLAVLVAHGPVVVTRDAIVDHVWGADAPATAGNVVQVYVSQLRQALGREVILTEASGYRFALGADQVDAWEFVELVKDGSRELSDGRFETAAELLRRALGLWDGAAFTGLEDIDVLRAEADRLDQLRLTALERCLQADLGCGRHDQAVPELEALVTAHPLHERFWAQLMRALYAAGRQADALDAFQRARAVLLDEIGVEPGPELRELEAAVLRQDTRLGGGLAAVLPALPPGLSIEGPAFVGRDAELAWLVSALEHAQAADGAVTVLLEGAPGIGKTRLVAEFARIARTRGIVPNYAAGVDALASDVAAGGVQVLDDLDQMPAIAAGEFVRKLAESPSGVLTVVCYSAALATLPIRVAVAGLSHAGAEVRTLGPMTVEDVSRVARGYDAAAADPELVSFANEVGEVSPLTAHEVASAWAIARASRRVQAAAVQLTEPTARARAAREHLVDSLQVAHAAHERHRRLGPSAPVRPYLGLLAYGSKDADVFFGRERLVAELLARLVGSRLVLLVGASGSGKSSVVRAGLLPALAAGALPGSERWSQLLMTPGGKPDETLTALLQDGGGTHRLVVIDQLEEIFTSVGVEARDLFGESLSILLNYQDAQVVATVRADFFDQCAAWPPLAAWLPAALALMTPLGRDELRRVVELPALLAGGRFEDGLADRILEDISDQPGGLPLLSTALAELWERRDGDKLTQEAYRESGGVVGAVNRLAETTYGALSPDEQEVARRILLRLADLGPEGVPVRRRRPVDQIAPSNDELGRQVIQLLASRRLLVIDRDTVEVAHEALFAEWARLATWLAEDAEGNRIRQRLTPAAHAWQEAGRPSGDLYRGPRLITALDYAAAHPLDLTTVEHDFLNAGRAHADAERLRQRRSVRRLRTLAGSMAVLLIGIGITAYVADNQRDRAQEERLAAQDSLRRAAARSMALQSEQAVQPDRALLLAAQAVQLDENLDTKTALLKVLDRTDHFAGRLPSSGAAIDQLEASPRGDLLALRDANGEVTVVHVGTGAPALDHPLLLTEPPRDLAFSPDGTRLVVLHQSGMTVFSSARLEDDETISLSMSGDEVEFLQDATHVVVSGHDSITRKPRVSVWNIDTRDRVRLGGLRPLGGTPRLTRLTDGRVATLTDPAILFDPKARIARPLGPRLHADDAFSVRALSPDGRLIAGGTATGTVAVWDTRTGQRISTTTGHALGVAQVRWSPDSRSFSTAGADGTAVIWRARPLERRLEFSGHRGVVTDVAFSAEGDLVVTGGRDGAAYLWDLSDHARLGSPLLSPPTPAGGYGLMAASMLYVDPSTPAGPFVAGFHFTETGGAGENTVVRWCPNKTTRCPDPLDTRLPDQLDVFQPLDPSGDRFFASTRSPSRPNWPGLWHILRRGGEHWSVDTFDALGTSPEVAPDGTVLAGTNSNPGFRTYRFFNLTNRQPVGRPIRIYVEGFDLNVGPFSPDGKLLLMPRQIDRKSELGGAYGGVIVVNVSERRDYLTLAMPGAPIASAVTYSPDGRYLAIASKDGSIQTHTSSDLRGTDLPLPEYAGQANSLEFSTDNTSLLQAGPDGLIIWDLQASEPSGLRLPIDPRPELTARFLSSAAVVTDETDGTLRRWPLHTPALVRLACTRVRRDLSAQEWQDAAPGQPPRATCPATI